jgi:4-amino-4-deoxy-L-arabinose transferase-like glycosyltransferase
VIGDRAIDDRVISVSTKPDRVALACLFVGSAIVNLALFAWMGVRHGGDTTRYLSSADDLLAGRPFAGPGGWVYFGYNGLIALCEAGGVGQVGLILVQILVAALATLALYDLGRQLAGPLAGLLAGGFFILDYDIAQWHTYVLTDSLYISLVALATWMVHRAAGGGMRRHLEALVVVTLAALIRPNGWILIPIAAIYWIARTRLSAGRKYAAALSVSLLCVSVAVTIVVTQLMPRAQRSSAATPGQPANSQRLPFVPALAARYSLDATRIPGRLVATLLHVQKTFSFWHNAAIVAVVGVVYPLAAWGFIRTRRRPLSRLMAVVIGGHLFIVAVTFADRDGRYLLYSFPLMVVFAAGGAAALRR